MKVLLKWLSMLVILAPIALFSANGEGEEIEPGVYLDASDQLPLWEELYDSVRPAQHTILLSPVEVTVFAGSLKKNVERIMQEHNWHLEWRLEFDYNWVKDTILYAEDLPGIVEQVINNLPVQAVFYEGNNVVVFQPRTLQ